jgi:hypothetical protein
VLNHLLARHDFLRRAAAVGLVPPLAAVSYVTLYASPAEKAILFFLIVGGVAAGWRLIRRSTRASKTEAGTFLDSRLRGNDKTTAPEAGQNAFLFTAS